MAERGSPLPDLLRADTLERQQVERIWSAIAAARAGRCAQGGRARGLGLGGLGLSASAALALGVALVSLSSPSPSPEARTPQASIATSLTRSDGSAFERLEAGPTRPARVVLSDGSSVEVRPLGLLEPVELSAERVVLQLQRGAARFVVRPGGPRRWIVEAGAARVEVIGTRFEVIREQGATRVRVEQGKVLVRGAGLPQSGVQLTVGDEVRVDPGAAREPAPESVAEQAAARPTGADERAETGRSAPAMARKRGAVAAGAAATVEPTSVEALLMEADRLRVAREHAAAARVLERVLQDHAGDPRAALAAFTLGRLREHALGDARGAAKAYERALALGLSGALADDARTHLARTPGAAEAAADPAR